MADWVSDSLVGFLRSPMWSYPVQSFIDHHCVVFDTDEENKFSYTDIHKEYQAVVEDLMESFMADLGITSEQFLEACSPDTKDREEHEHLFEQVLASEDFMLFKSMMVQRNIDLELQTLALLKKQLGHSPEAYDHLADTKEPLGTRSEEERIMEEILKQSKEEYEQNVLKEKEMEKLVSLVKEESLQLYQAAHGEGEQELELTGKVDKVTLSDEEASPKQADVLSSNQSVTESTGASITEATQHHPPVKTESIPSLETPQEKRQQAPLQPISGPKTLGIKQDLSGTEAAAMWLESAKADVQQGSTTGTTTQSVHVAEDIRAREAYLRRQRDHLLEKKRKERAKHFDSFSASQSSQRPQSVQVAKSVAEGTVKGRREGGEKTEATGKGRSTGVLCSAIAGRLKKEFA